MTSLVSPPNRAPFYEMRFSNYYIFFVKAVFHLLLIRDKLFILLQSIWDLSATRKKNKPSISCTAQQRLVLMGHWKQPYSNFIFCHLNDVSCEKPLLAYSEEEAHTRLMASDITDVLSAILFLSQPLIFIFVPLFSFYNLLFVNGKFDFFCFLFTVSNQEIYCVSVYIYYFFIARSVCFSVNISPIW